MYSLGLRMILLCILIIGCSRTKSQISHQLEKTKILLSIADEAGVLYGAVMGGPPPPNSCDNPMGSISRWTEIYKDHSQNDIPALQALFGYLPPDIAVYLAPKYPYELDYREILLDPLSPTGEPFFLYIPHQGGDIALSSVGPDGVRDILADDVFWRESQYFSVRDINAIYDPTNGLVSRGDIVLSPYDRTWYVPTTLHGKRGMRLKSEVESH